MIYFQSPFLFVDFETVSPIILLKKASQPTHLLNVQSLCNLINNNLDLTGRNFKNLSNNFTDTGEKSRYLMTLIYFLFRKPFKILKITF